MGDKGKAATEGLRLSSSGTVDQIGTVPSTGTTVKIENANENETTMPSATARTPTDKTPKKTSRLDMLKQTAMSAEEEEMSESMATLSLFDNVLRGEVEAKKHTKPSMGAVEGGFVFAGRNIGACQTEPVWTAEQMKAVNTITSTKLAITMVNDSRKSIPDDEGTYVGENERGEIVAKRAAYLSRLPTDHYQLGCGQPKLGTTGGTAMYMDIVSLGTTESWMLNQHTSEGVVIDGVGREILDRTSKAKRRIGHDFARIGLPKFAFGALFNTLEVQFPGILDKVRKTDGYYWMNASWGVNNMGGGTYIYVTKEGQIKQTRNLSEVLRLLQGKSSFGIATVAISASFSTKKLGERVVPDVKTAGLSVKLHTAVHIKPVDFHGPPQTGTAGLELLSTDVAGMMPLQSSGMPNTMVRPGQNTAFSNFLDAVDDMSGAKDTGGSVDDLM